ncbi:MAG TPA: 3-hydroxybutyrate dehydrogenase [Chitinophagaceae bacterium]|nr:3-hydroxybutyrate dehydrogenase [Chitinophagaceae bacterium]
MHTKTALITGSTSGIGLGIANAFAEKGYNIMFNGLEQDGSEIAAAIALQYTVAYSFSPVNMLDTDGLENLVDETVQRFGSVDVLVNNAGIQHVSPIEHFDAGKWNDVIAVNLTAPFHLTKAVWPYMKKQQYGRIINIASAHGLFASENKSAYVASKHGIIGLTKTAALEGAAFNITCNAICPGYVNTPLVQKQITDRAAEYGLTEEQSAEKYFLSKHAVKKFIPVETIAAMAVFLASPGAYAVTGGSFPVDAGWGAQ